jgi:hypothetical protein
MVGAVVSQCLPPVLRKYGEMLVKKVIVRMFGGRSVDEQESLRIVSKRPNLQETR